MKFIEDLRGIHQGEEIWIIGAGPSLDAYPINFFKDKVCIGMNWVFSVFLDIGDGIKKFDSKAYYSVHEHREAADWIVEHKPEHLKDCFFLLPPKRRHGKDLAHQMIWWEDYNKDPYYMRWGLKGKAAVSATDQDFVDVADCIMKKGECHYVCRGTTLHWAIQAAVVLGAKKVCVAGGGAKGGHMTKHGSHYVNIRDYGDKYSHWLAGTRSLAAAFKPHGIKIVFYYYGQGERA